jgi:hypothetical protein
MLIEAERRQAEFRPGVSVVLGDGNNWTLPDPRSLWPLVSASGPSRDGEDHLASGTELGALLDAVCEVEDQAEGQRAELALTIFLLMLNYHLEPDDLARLLSFSPDDPRGAAARQVVHDWVGECLDRFRGLAAASRRLQEKRGPFRRLIHFWTHRGPQSRSGRTVSPHYTEGR